MFSNMSKLELDMMAQREWKSAKKIIIGGIGISALLFGSAFGISEMGLRHKRAKFREAPEREGKIFNMTHYTKCVGRTTVNLFDVTLIAPDGTKKTFTYRWDRGVRIFESYRVGDPLKYHEGFSPFEEESLNKSLLDSD